MKNAKQYLPGLIILVLFAILSLFIYGDYGISFDEVIQHEIGEVNYNYIFKNDNTLDTYLDKEYGVGFELPLIIIEKVFKLKDPNDIYTMRHMVTHFPFLICMFAGYILALKLFKNQFVAIATFLMLLLCPRIYAHSYFNTKDIPSLSLVVLCFTAQYYALTRKSIIGYSIAGIVCGFAIGLRLMNLIIAAPLLGFLIIDIIRNIKNSKVVIRYLLSFALFILLSWLVVVASWPALWKDPYIRIVEFYQHLSKFRWNGNVLLNGQIFQSSELPWFYIPLWFTITVPILWQTLSLIGIVAILLLVFKKSPTIASDAITRLLLIFVFCFIGPVVVVIYLKAVLYDDWRHLYFIYPSFVFLAAYALNKLIKTKLKTPIISLFAIQLALVLFFFVQYHPNQNVYFNEFVPRSEDYLMKHYELDYWKHSFRQGLKWIAENSNKKTIYVNDGNMMLDRNILISDTSIRNRFKTTNTDSLVDYHLQVFRTVPYKYSREKSIHEIDVLGSPILRITKLK